MANWPSSPEWTNISEINGNEQFNSGDGVTFNDFNTIIKNLIYLKNQGTAARVQTKTISPTANGTYEVYPDGGYLLSHVTVEVDVEGGGVTLPQLFTPTAELNGTTISITDTPDNGDFTEEYAIIADGVIVKTAVKSSVEPTLVMITDILGGGVHVIAVAAVAPFFRNSEPVIVSSANVLDAPVISVSTEDNQTIEFAPVEHANQYEVYVDGESIGFYSPEI